MVLDGAVALAAVTWLGAAGAAPGASVICRSPFFPIPDVTPPEGVTDLLEVAEEGTILDLDVSLVVPHTWVGDLGFVIDDGTRSAVLMDRPGVPGTIFGCSRDDVDATLDDEAAEPVENVCADPPPAIGGALDPNGDLSVFDGAPVAGTWTLTIHDSAAGDVGVLETWCLEVTLDPMPFVDGFESGDTTAWTSTVP